MIRRLPGFYYGLNYTDMFKVPEHYRLFDRRYPQSSTKSDGRNGVFMIPHYKISGYGFQVIASDGSAPGDEQEWEHISVSLYSKKREVKRCPTWEEMCYVKDLFWDMEDRAVQYHPPESEYVHSAGDNEWILHIWRPVGVEIPHPPSIMAGFTDKQKVNYE